MAKLTEAVSAVTPLGDALREPAKAPRRRRESTAREPLGRAWSCPCHETRFDDLREIYLHIRAELQARDDARDSRGHRRVAKCGTSGGYRAHLRKDETPCDLCRSDQAAYQAARRAANPDKVDARRAEYRATHREQIRARAAAYYAANSGKDRARSAAYRAGNREEDRARSAAYYAANRDAINAAKRASRAARKAMSSSRSET